MSRLPVTYLGPIFVQNSRLTRRDLVISEQVKKEGTKTGPTVGFVSI